MTTATLAVFTPEITMVILAILLAMFLAKKLPQLVRALKDEQEED